MRFTDTKGRQWSIAFNCGAVVLLERELGLKALDFEGHFWPAWTDKRRSVDMVWALVMDQAERRKVSMMDFLETLDEKALQAARDALLSEYIGFFQSPTKRSLLERLRSEMAGLQEAIERNLTSRLEAMLTRSAGGLSSSSPA